MNIINFIEKYNLLNLLIFVDTDSIHKKIINDEIEFNDEIFIIISLYALTNFITTESFANCYHEIIKNKINIIKQINNDFEYLLLYDNFITSWLISNFITKDYYDKSQAYKTHFINKINEINITERFDKIFIKYNRDEINRYFIVCSKIMDRNQLHSPGPPEY
jgi:hypothetical protein